MAARLPEADGQEEAAAEAATATVMLEHSEALAEPDCSLLTEAEELAEAAELPEVHALLLREEL